MFRRRWLFLAALLSAEAAGTYWKFVRPGLMYWGATDNEIARRLPLDEAIGDPTSVSTRGITIAARPEEVWPWLVQMGDSPRAGYYSYAWIERRLGMEIENSNRILAQYQDLKAGDCIDKNQTMMVLAVDPGNSLVLGPPPSVDWLRCTWAFTLQPIDEHQTRLVTRVRAKWHWLEMLRKTPPPMWPVWLVLDPGVFIMERKMLRGIKQRVESHARGESLLNPAAS